MTLDRSEAQRRRSDRRSPSRSRRRRASRSQTPPAPGDAAFASDSVQLVAPIAVPGGLRHHLLWTVRAREVGDQTPALARRSRSCVPTARCSRCAIGGVPLAVRSVRGRAARARGGVRHPHRAAARSRHRSGYGCCGAAGLALVGLALRALRRRARRAEERAGRVADRRPRRAGAARRRRSRRRPAAASRRACAARCSSSSARIWQRRDDRERDAGRAARRGRRRARAPARRARARRASHRARRWRRSSRSRRARAGAGAPCGESSALSALDVARLRASRRRRSCGSGSRSCARSRSSRSRAGRAGCACRARAPAARCAGRGSTSRSLASLALRLGALALLALTLARPVGLVPENPAAASGVDLVIALDASGSMLALDASSTAARSPGSSSPSAWSRTSCARAAAIASGWSPSASTPSRCARSPSITAWCRRRSSASRSAWSATRPRSARRSGSARGGCSIAGGPEDAQRVLVLVTDGRHNSGKLAPKTAAELATLRGRAHPRGRRRHHGARAVRAAGRGNADALRARGPRPRDTAASWPTPPAVASSTRAAPTTCAPSPTRSTGSRRGRGARGPALPARVAGPAHARARARSCSPAKAALAHGLLRRLP